MPIYKRGAKWLVSVGSGSERYRESFTDYAQALMEEQKQKLIRSGVIDLPEQFKSKENSVPTLEDAYKLTVKDVWSQRKSDHGIKCANVVLKLLGKSTPVTSINTSMIREMVDELEDERGLAGSSVNARLSALSMMLKTAADEGWIETMPRIKRRSPGDHRIRWIDNKEELQLLNACTTFGFPALRDFVVVAIDTGFRRMELLNFESKQYRNGMLHLHPDETKTSKARSIPATSRVHEILMARKHKDRVFDDLTVNTLRNQWAQVREYLGKTNDPQYVVHMLRHTCASRLAMQDKSAQFIQAWMGHATPLTTARYMHLAPGKLKEGKEALEQYKAEHNPMLLTA